MNRRAKDRPQENREAGERRSRVQRNRGVSPPAAVVSSRGRLVGVCFALALGVWVVFGQTTRHEFVNFDDDVYVYENQVVSQGITWRGIAWAFANVHGANWHPLTTLSHLLDCQLFGLNPAGPHLVNVCLHGATAILLFLVLRNLTGALWQSAFVAAVFAVHPLRVESVAWVAERKDVLSGLFFVLTIGAYSRYARRPFTLGRYAMVVALFALGLLCKPMLVTLPFVLLLLDYWPLGRWSNRPGHSAESPKKLIAEKIPLLLIAAVVCAVTLLVQKQVIQLAQHWPLSLRAGNAAVSCIAYVVQMIYPAGLAVLYPHPGAGLPGWWVGASVLALLLITAAAGAIRGKHPYVLIGWLWYLGMLVPVIGLVQVGIQARADRYTYLPQIGLYLMVAWGSAHLCNTWRQGRTMLGWAAAATILALAVAARNQTTHWRDSVSLWSHTLAGTAKNPMAHLNLARALSRESRLPEAIQEYEKALALDPDFAEARISLGAAQFLQGRINDAVQNYERALALKPDSPAAHYNLGTALAAQGKFTEAIQHLERAVALQPDYADARVNLGNALGRVGKTKEAIQQFAGAVRLRPGVVEIHISLGNALGRDGQLPEALPAFERALRLKPDSAEAHLGMGTVLVAQGKPNEALRHLQPALNFAIAQGNAALAEHIQEQLQLCQAAATRPQSP